jgi:hypothetical protein
MAIVDDFTPAAAVPPSGRGLARRVRARWAAFFGAIAAGGRASADYGRLSVMTDRQLELRGLTRSDIPREIHRRHFTAMRGELDGFD